MKNKHITIDFTSMNYGEIEHHFIYLPGNDTPRCYHKSRLIGHCIAPDVEFLVVFSPFYELDVNYETFFLYLTNDGSATFEIDPSYGFKEFSYFKGSWEDAYRLLRIHLKNLYLVKSIGISLETYLTRFN